MNQTDAVTEAAMALVCALHPDRKFLSLHETYNRLPDTIEGEEKTKAIEYLEKVGFLERTQPPHFPGFFITQPNKGE